MPNEIQITSKLNVSKNGASATNLTSTETLDMDGSNLSSIVQNVGTSFEAASVGDVDTSANYWIQIYNMGTTQMTVSYNSGTTEHDLIPAGALWGPVLKKGGNLVYLKFATAEGLANITACES